MFGLELGSSFVSVGGCHKRVSDFTLWIRVELVDDISRHSNGAGNRSLTTWRLRLHVVRFSRLQYF